MHTDCTTTQASSRKRTFFRAPHAIASWVLACAFMLAALPASAWADDALSSSAEADVLWTPHVSITAEHDPQNPEYLRIQATGTNDSPTTVHDANLEFVLPDQLVIVKGEKLAHAESLEAGASLSGEIIATSAENAADDPYQEPGRKPDDSSSNGTSSNVAPSPFAQTNDELGGMATTVAIVAIAAAAGVALALRRRAQARKKASDAFCLLLCGTLVIGLAPAFPQTARADETTPATTGYASTQIDVNGTPLEVSATLSISSADDLPEGAYPATAWLSTETYVAHNATKAHISIASDKPFAAQLDASAFSLDGALADCTVTEASRISDTQADLTIEGLAASDGEDGSIHAAAAAFAEGATEGFGIIPVEAPQATLSYADEEAEGWNGSTQFILPIDIGCAEFSGAAQPSAFSLPADSSISVQDVRCSEGDHEALVTFSVPDESPEEQFETLDAALTEAGVRIDAAATNCGELTAVSHDVTRAPEYGYETTALEYADATFLSRVRITDARAEEADGAVTLVCEATVKTADGGTVNLTEAETELEVFGLLLDESGEFTEGASIVDQGTLAVTGPDSFTFETTLDASDDEESVGEADAFWALVEDDDQCENPLNHLEETAAQTDWALASCMVIMSGPGVTNKWGVPLSFASAPVLTDDEYQSLARDGGLTDAEIAERALLAAQEAFNAAGSFAKAVMDKDFSEAFHGIGSVLGFAAKLVSVSSPPQYTLADVMNRLDVMQESLNTLESGVSQLNMQLEAFESRSAYRTALTQLSSYTDILGEDEGIALMISNALENVDTESNAASFAELSEADQEEMHLLAESTRAYSQRHGTETLALTKGLGNLITGNAAISANGIGSLYFDYVDTYYNWEPQTFDARKQFLAYVGAAYLNGYTASMCELNVELADAQAAGDNARIQATESALRTLSKQAGKVGEVISGQVDETGKLIAKSKLASRTQARADGGVLNLVTKSVFSAKNSGDAGMIAAESVATRSGMDYASVLQSRDIGRVNMGALDTSISEAQFVDMGKRLKARSSQEGYTGPKNLSEEFESLGIACSESYGTWSYDLGKNRVAKVNASTEQAHQHVVKLNPKKPTSDHFAVYHEIVQTGDVYDTKSDSVKRGVPVYRAWTKYYAGKFYWTLNIHFGDFRVWSVAGENDEPDDDENEEEEWDDDMVTR